jgi:GT2 family glycosyltransferase
MSIKVTIGIPTNRGLRPKMAQAVLELVAHGGYDFHILVAEEGYTIAENRNYIAVQACNNKSDYLLFIDDDMVFPPDTLDRLLAHKKEIVSIAYHSRGSKDKIKLVENDIMAIAETEKGKYINFETNNDPKYKQLFECFAGGTGTMLIKTEVFLKTKRPWFEFTYFENGKCKEGEDWNFCFKAKEAGYKIWCDPTLKVGHIGEKIY